MSSFIRDGVEMTYPTPEEMPKFLEWLKINNDKDPFHPDQHYDYVGAFRAGINRTDQEGNQAPFPKGHFPDTFKLPGHPTFSIESKYYKEGMPAGIWDGETYIPINKER